MHRGVAADVHLDVLALGRPVADVLRGVAPLAHVPDDGRRDDVAGHPGRILLGPELTLVAARLQHREPARLDDQQRLQVPLLQQHLQGTRLIVALRPVAGDLAVVALLHLAQPAIGPLQRLQLRHSFSIAHHFISPFDPAERARTLPVSAPVSIMVGWRQL